MPSLTCSHVSAFEMKLVFNELISLEQVWVKIGKDQIEMIFSYLITLKEYAVYTFNRYDF